MFNKIKTGYRLGRDFSELLKHAENDLDPVLFPKDCVGKKYDFICKEVSIKGLFSELGFKGYFLFNPLNDYQKSMESKLVYLDLRKGGIITDSGIRTIENIL